MLRAVCVVFRTGPDTVVLNPSEPSKEKEKQGFFRAIKKKKKKSQMVTCTRFPKSVFHELVLRCPSVSPALPLKCSVRWRIEHTCRNIKSSLVFVLCIGFPCATSHPPLYCRCRSLKEGLLSSRKVFSLCLAQRIA